MSSPGRAVREILITVKTYPTPSTHYAETVCVAGVDVKTGEWIRLYPVPFRELPEYQQFRKYQVVRVAVRKHKRDPRPESYDPEWESFEPLEFIDTRDGWETRRHLLSRAISQSMCEVAEDQEAHGTSLGCFRPAVIEDFIVKEDSPDWTGKQKQAMAQLRLFRTSDRPLEKMPIKCYYKYRCDSPDCSGHTQSVLDWELFQYYRRVREECHSPKEIAERLRDRFLGELCASDRDPHLFVGNHSSHFNRFMVLGVFWPPRGAPSLF